MNPKITALAGCIICNKDGEVIVLHRKTTTHNHWEIPGGNIKQGETAEAAAVRGLREELGVTVRLSRKLGDREFSEGNSVFHCTWFLAEIVSGEPRLQEPDTFDKWGEFSLVTLTQRYGELSAGAKSFLEAMAYGEIDLAV